MAKLFLTGSTGFLGQRLRARLQRDGVAFAELSRARGADLGRPESYAGVLAGADTAVHLAAATGNAPAAVHFATNAAGTRALLAECARQGVKRFVLLSSIAATFPDVRHYPYARSKREAEEAVRSSGLGYTIVRPTIITGRGAPVLMGLRRLAGLPVVPVFGAGTARVQPILVDDLVECLMTILAQPLGGETIELGGPEVVTIEQLLGEMHRTLRGRTDPRLARAFHIPLGPLLPVLTALEAVVPVRLPVTVGQLSTFRFDGVAAPHPVHERHRAGMAGVRRQVEMSFGREG